MNKAPTCVAAMAALVLAALAPAEAAQHAAKVVYAFGQVEAHGSGGQARKLARGDAIVPGDTVVTRRGRAQLRFTDGGFAALQPGTEYRVDDYAFEGKADGSERSFLSLVRGSVRLVTGIIGRANKQNYRIRTSVATIGIRGTSGRLSHCEANCGARGPGTKLQGYGGTWDLESGQFKGPVASGEARFCNGTDCFKLPGFGQRRDVAASGEDEAEGEQDSAGEETAENAYSQGSQVGADGTQCDLGGGCGDIVVSTGLVGAEAFQVAGFGGDTENLSDLVVVSKGGVPVAGLEFDDGSDGHGPELGILTTDVTALRTAFNASGNPDIAAAGNAILNAIPGQQKALLASMPAVVGQGDFGRTSDNRLVKGRWTNGFVMEIEVSLDGTPELFSDVFRLTGFQSEHFIFGPDPLFVPFAGQARYDFTGGTFSTAVDGSSIGQGVTGGLLAFDFGSGAGIVDMTVRHGLMTLNVLGGLQLEFDEPKLFFDAGNVVAATLAGSYPVTIDGFFAVPNGTKAPLAAGLAYVIDTPTQLIGTAGFGLSASTVPPIASPTGGAVPAATGSYIAFTHHYLASGISPTTNADDFIVGPMDTAATTGGVVTSFNSTTPVDLCSGVPCTFDALGAAVVKDPTGPGGSTSNAALGVSWARFGGGHTIAHNDFPTPNGPFHVLKVDVPTAMGAVPTVASGLQGQYNMIVGGSRPTVVFETNAVQQTPIVGNLTVANMNIVFDMGTLTASFQGNFPAGGGTGMFALGGSGAFSSAVDVHSLALTGTVSSAAISAAGGSPDCSGSCALFGHTHFDVIGVAATGVAGAVEASTVGLQKFGVAGTYVLQGAVVPYP